MTDPAFQNSGLIPGAGRYLRTLARLHPAQVVWRIVRAAQKPFAPAAARRAGRCAPLPFDPDALSRLGEFMREAARAGLVPPPETAAAIRERRMLFLNTPSPVPGAFSWNTPERPILWRYQLHGFRWLALLALDNALSITPGGRETAREAVLDWIEKNPAGQGDAWEPFPVSERLLHWALAESVFRLDEPRMETSYSHQARWLARRFEWDLRGNHLLKNACALTVAGCVLGDPSLRGTGEKTVLRELDRQVLPDGGHFERSPMYHAHALWDLLAAMAALGDTESAARILPAAARMADFLQGVCHPDGDIPLFNDAVLGEAFPGRPLAAFAAARCGRETHSATSFPDTGMHVLDNPAGRMILKAAPVPGEQPGHAHADPMTFELSLGHTRVLVDAGCHGYAESPRRGWNRSVHAHNTAVVGEREPLEAWSVFRVGRRYRPPTARMASGENELRFAGEVVLPDGTVHRREVLCLRAPAAWRIRDSAAHRDGSPAGLVALCHAAPGTVVERRDDGSVALSSGGALLVVVPESGTLLTAALPEEGAPLFWYSPRFGVAEPAPTLRCAPERPGGRCGVWLCPPTAEGPVREWMRGGEF